MVAAAVFVAGILVGADSMSRAIAVPTYIADVIVAVSLLAMLVATMLVAVPGPALGARRHRTAACCRPPRRRCEHATFWVAVLRIATPLIFGTLGVLLCERAGVLNLGIEGIMVAGAFAGWLAVYQGDGLWTGVAVAALDRRAVRPAARLADGAAGAVAARVRTRHHAVRHQPRLLCVSRDASRKVTTPPTIEPFSDDGWLGCRSRCWTRRRR